MGKKNNGRKNGDDKYAPTDALGKIHGAFETLAVTDTTERFENTNIPKPSDENVKEGREWVNYNKK